MHGGRYSDHDSDSDARGDDVCEPVELFCEFLACRLRTENAELLRRIAREFLEEPPAFETVDSMVELAYPMIAVVPIENGDAAQRLRADALLRRMRRVATDGDDGQFNAMAREVNRRIELKNWHWLVLMYAEFCVGRDRSVKRFVASRAQAILVLPVAPAIVPVAPAIVPVAPAIVAAPTRVNRFHPYETKKSSIKHDANTTERYIDRRSTPAKRSATRRKTKPYPLAPGYSKERKFDDIVDAALERIEAKAPWTRLFDVSRIEFPFDTRRYPALKERFASFWRDHAHAVWVRHFWCRFPEANVGPGSRYYGRKIAQRVAVQAFVKDVITPIFDTLGAQFFVLLDTRKDPFHWWWYRRPVTELSQVVGVAGLDAALQYMQSQRKVRIPELPAECTTPLRQKKVSCLWPNIRRISHIKDAMDEIRHATERRAMLQQLKRQHYGFDSDDEEEDGGDTESTGSRASSSDGWS